MTVTKPLGFRAAGIAVGLKTTGKPDLALIVNDGPKPAAAAVYTSNRAKANPVLWSQAANTAETVAVVLNSGGANCFTGEFGYQTSKLSAEAVAEALSIDPLRVQVCSTGLIGAGGQDFRDRIVNGIPELVSKLGDNSDDAAAAILTTDTVTKTASYESEDGWRIGAIAKGAGMLAPGLATMLVVITTDAVVDAASLDSAVREATEKTLNRLDSDGCMSTNDQVTLLASGAAEVTPDLAEFNAALVTVCDSLAKQLQADAEGASHQINIEVTGAKSEADAVTVGRTLARNNLFKTAIFGNDPNWGRVLAAIGTTDAHFDPYAVAVSFNGVRLCNQGGPDRPVTECDLTPAVTEVLIELNAADPENAHSAVIRTNDLTVAYVHENSAYSS